MLVSACLELAFNKLLTMGCKKVRLEKQFYIARDIKRYAFIKENNTVYLSTHTPEGITALKEKLAMNLLLECLKSKVGIEFIEDDKGVKNYDGSEQ